MFIITLTISAQAPQGFNYQAAVRNNIGALIINKNVTFKFNIIPTSATGTPVYTESQTVTTDDLGAVNLFIGKGTPITGTFAAIDWATGTYFLGIELNTGDGFKAMGTSQLLSVPYALYANNSGSTNKQSKTSIYLTGNITDAQTAIRLANELGPDTENIYIRNTTQLTTVDLSSVVNAVKIDIFDNAVLTNVNLNSLTTVFDAFNVIDNPVLNLSCPLLKDCYYSTIENIPSLNVSALMYSNSIRFSNITNCTPPSNLINCSYLSLFNLNNINTLNFPSLVKSQVEIGFNRSLTSINLSNLTSGTVGISNNSLITSVEFPELTIGGVRISENPLLTSIRLPKLTDSEELRIFSNSALTSIDLTALKNSRNISIFFNRSLTSLSLTSLINTPTISLVSNALTTNTVNSLLNKFLTVLPLSKNISLNQQSPAAPPTGQGIIDRQTLRNAGNSVTTD